MPTGQGLVAHWYYHVPNLLMLAVGALLLVRLAVALVVPPENPALRAVAVLTDPVLKPVAAITPRLVPATFVMICAVVWLLLLRMALFVAVSATGARL
jgi:uncharacterized protein YggT (Ycf19 family)